jgi:hypothetical protein
MQKLFKEVTIFWALFEWAALIGHISASYYPFYQGKWDFV